MSKLNEGLDPNNPSHQIVIEINNRNEEKYGPYNEEMKLFQAFVSNGNHNYEIPKTTPKYNYKELNAAFDAGKSRDYESLESWLEYKKTNEKNGN